MSNPSRSVYSITFTGVPVSAAHDFFEISPAANKPLMVHGIMLTQTSEPTTEEEQLTVQLVRGHTVSGSGGSAFTPIPLVSDDAAAAFACEINNTTLASAGTPVVLHSEAFNSRMGWYYVPTPEMRPALKVNTTGLVVRLLNAPVDPITFNGTMYVEER